MLQPVTLSAPAEGNAVIESRIFDEIAIGRVSATRKLTRDDIALFAECLGAPAKHLVSIEDVSAVVALLATDHAKLITGETVYVDGGYHIMG